MNQSVPTPIPAAVNRLRAILSDDVPYCSGTLVGQPRDFLLYYGKGDQIGRIDLANATSSELDRLTQACEPASFGLNQLDVLDESYRKAGKLDLDSFVLAFSAENAGLVKAVHTGLFPGEKSENREIRAELYKLNVYGKDAFFKSHKDTPRAGNMFGSLVIVFPTPHVGGALIVRHEGREWTFDSGKLLSEPGLSPSIAFAAFFSDVDHEVTPVVAGHRVSATYNLFFEPSDTIVPNSTAAPYAPAVRMLTPTAADPSQVADSLRELLEEPTFLPNGGTLGFGLRHQYPLPTTWSWGDPDPLPSLEAWLKGSDAALLHACHAHGLCPELKLLHEETRDRIKPVLLDHVPVVDVLEDGTNMDFELLRYGGTRMYRVDLFENPERYSDSTYITEAEELEYSWGRRAVPEAVAVYMLTDVTSINQIKTTFATYGNEPTMDMMYMNVCLVVYIGPAGERDNLDGAII